MFEQVVTAIALVLVIEGLLPFISPAAWRELMRQLTALPDKPIRMAGLMSMLLGTMLLYII